MKKAFFRIAGILALALMVAPQIVHAQDPVLVNVPFAFTAGKTTLPAGEYMVQKSKLDGMTLSIQRIDTGTGIYVPSLTAESKAPQTESKLIFHRYGDRYFLSQIWVEGDRRGRELPKSAQEKEQALTASKDTQDQVTIVALLVSHK